MKLVLNCVMVYLFLAAMVCSTFADEVLVIKADSVDTVSGEIIQNGIIVIRNGRITAVSAEAKIPDGAEIIDAHNKTVFPGLINPFSHIGLSSPRGAPRRAASFRRSPDGGGSNPHYRVVDELYPHQDAYKRILQAGFTTLALVPSRGTDTIAGQGVIIRPHGESPDEMVISESGLLMVYFQASTKAKDALKSALESGKKKPEAADPKIAPLVKAVNGELPTFIHSNSPGDTVHLLKLLESHDKMKTSLICGPENIHLAEQLAKKNFFVIVPARIDYEPFTTNRINVARTLAETGVKIACHPVADTVQGHEDFLRQMAQLVKAGLDKNIAKKAITLHPAQMLGLDYRLGSLEIGKDANLLILSGDPLDTDTIIHRIIIEGKTVHQNP